MLLLVLEFVYIGKITNVFYLLRIARDIFCYMSEELSSPWKLNPPAKTPSRSKADLRGEIKGVNTVFLT